MPVSKKGELKFSRPAFLFFEISHRFALFIIQYTRWYGESQVQGVLDVATDLALSTFNLCAASYPGGEASRLMMLESSISPGKEAALTLKEILCQHPNYFVSNSAITALGGE